MRSFIHFCSDQACGSEGSNTAICLQRIRRIIQVCMTRRIEVKEVTQEYVYRESEGLYTSAVTRHVEVKGVMQQFLYQLIYFMRIVTWTVD
jgi:hypothetical protein